MGIVYRGRRVNYDNVAVGSAWLGPENTLGMSTQQDNITAVTDVSLYNRQAVSAPGCAIENAAGGASGTFTNIANAELPGVEDTDNGTADKLTSDGEVVHA